MNLSKSVLTLTSICAALVAIVVVVRYPVSELLFSSNEAEVQVIRHRHGGSYSDPRSLSASSFAKPPQRVVDPRIGSTRKADVTAVILNWSRFPNVLKISSLLCSDSLEDTIASIFIFNNSPWKLSFEDFRSTGCARHRLNLFNSPSNILFEARFLACAQATTTYCFIQDDDYLIRPEIIWAMRSVASETVSLGPIYLSPPHEKLSTTFRQISSDTLDTSFAWLGYGTLLRRSEAVSFLQLLDHLNATKTERVMADNYFAILRNSIPEAWFDQGLELGGGQPFTVGAEGDDRNHAHILKAAEYLASIVTCDGPPPCIEVPLNSSELPYVRLGSRGPSTSGQAKNSRSPCVGIPCVFETSIDLLPHMELPVASAPNQILENERRLMELLTDEDLTRFINSPPSHAVDALANTSFCVTKMKQGDFISLDSLWRLSYNWDNVEMVWLVDKPAGMVLRLGTFQFSEDADKWDDILDNTIQCTSTESEGKDCEECAIGVPAGRYFRMVVGEDAEGLFCIHELWLRGQVR